MSITEAKERERKELSLVYIAGNTREVESIEKLFTDNEVTYTLKATPFVHRTLFGTTRELFGVGFYVLYAQAPYCRNLLSSNNFKVGLVQEGEE